MRTCPLCCKTLIVGSEEECAAHIAQCSAFRAEYGPGARRAGLVGGFETAVAAAPPHQPSPAAVTAEPGLDESCARFAAALLPLVPLAIVSADARSTEEAAELIAVLANALITAPTTSQDFGPEELITITLGPYLDQLGAVRGAEVQAALARSLEPVQRDAASAACGGVTIQQLLQRCLVRQMTALRHCATCGRSGCRLLACSRCKVVHYCGSGCQRQGWATHKPHCTPPK